MKMVLAISLLIPLIVSVATAEIEYSKPEKVLSLGACPSNRFRIHGMEPGQLGSVWGGGDGTHEGPVRLHRLFVTPFADHVMVDRHGSRFKYLTVLPAAPNSQTWLSLKTAGIEHASQLFDTALIDGSGRIFALDILPRGERGPMRVFDTQGAYLGTVPDSPKKLVRIPGPGDFFVADSVGNIYQLTMVRPEDRPSKEGYINIWRWNRVR